MLTALAATPPVEVNVDNGPGWATWISLGVAVLALLIAYSTLATTRRMREEDRLHRVTGIASDVSDARSRWIVAELVERGFIVDRGQGRGSMIVDPAGFREAQKTTRAAMERFIDLASDLDHALAGGVPGISPEAHRTLERFMVSRRETTDADNDAHRRLFWELGRRQEYLASPWPSRTRMRINPGKPPSPDPPWIFPPPAPPPWTANSPLWTRSAQPIHMGESRMTNVRR